MPCREKQPFSQHLKPGINPTSERELTRKQKSPYTRSNLPTNPYFPNESPYKPKIDFGWSVLINKLDKNFDFSKKSIFEPP